MRFKNRRARFDYEVLDTYTAGIMLKGCEAKGLRNGKSSLNETFCYFKNGELFLRNCEITLDPRINFEKIPNLRDRKLLLRKEELVKLQKQVETKGLSIVPLELYINEKGLFKIDICLARGKKNYDKRNAIKEKDIKRDLDRVGKNK